MGKTATFIAEFLKDGHLSIPERVVKALSLEKGKKVKAIIETEKFNREEFLSLFGIWKQKTDKEINIYKEILREREGFGRGEVKL
jgi:bifunctional DNA-binding transcriptional regulator/antitoxin component of YhaV-PrlF toxin-antitoxin module